MQPVQKLVQSPSWIPLTLNHPQQNLLSTLTQQSSDALQLPGDLAGNIEEPFYISNLSPTSKRNLV